jgi:hypothetical protein
MRIAGELHDGVMQQISALSLLLGTGKRQSKAAAKKTMADVQRKLIEVGTEVRQLSHNLHPPMLRDAGCRRRSGATARSSATSVASPFRARLTTTGIDQHARANPSVERHVRIAQRAGSQDHRASHDSVSTSGVADPRPSAAVRSLAHRGDHCRAKQPTLPCIEMWLPTTVCAPGEACPANRFGAVVVSRTIVTLRYRIPQLIATIVDACSSTTWCAWA